MNPGTRVTWKDPEPDDRVGTVREPTAEELAYLATCAGSFRASVAGHVIVTWDGDEPWESAWTDPDDLEACP